MFEKAKRFLLEVRAELKKVSWPTRAETTTLTLLVVFMVILMTVYIGAWDFILQRAVTFLLNR